MAQVLTAIIITAATTLFVAAILFLFLYKLTIARKHQKNRLEPVSHHIETATNPQDIEQQRGTMKGIFVEKDGVEVLYVKKIEKVQLIGCFSKVWINPMNEEDEEEVEEKRMYRKPSIPKKLLPIQEMPLLHDPDLTADKTKHDAVAPPPPLPPPPSPPPPPPLLWPKPPAPPPLPPGPAKRSSGPPYPPAKAGGLMTSSVKPPPAPKWKMNGKVERSTGEREKGENNVQVKLKPLHWDKVNIANTEQSMVWNEIRDGSLKFDDELIEALFGYTPANTHGSSRVSTSASPITNPPSQIFILEPRKSQNTAIVLKSLALSRKEVLNSLLDGHGLNIDILEKLMRISPTQEEITRIFQFNGNPTKLASAESFLYYTLKALPSAFIRVSTMLFRSNYESEILHLKESLQTLELGCKELRTRGIFFKLLEAILKAGNHMNAGTSRGDAQGFNLNALRKLSYVKSTDGKTTLLHFVVEQVVRDEGRRCAISKSHSLEKSSDNKSSSYGLRVKEERDKEYLTLGAPILSGLNVNFSNVKKAATIDFDSFIKMLPNLRTRIGDIRKLVTSCGNEEKGGFAREMKGFQEECDAELRVVREEQARIMDIVERTTLYYQAGSLKEKGAHPLQLFVIVKDFLGLVDQASLDITKKIHKLNVKVQTSPRAASHQKNPVNFQIFQSQFTSDKPGLPSRDPEDDFQ